jgi:hypothetical protein
MIPADQVQAAREALYAYELNKPGKYYGEVDADLMWLLNDEGLTAKYDHGDVFITNVRQGKHYNLWELFMVLAPFVDNIGSVTIVTEEHEFIQYNFYYGGVSQRKGKIVFD